MVGGQQAMFGNFASYAQQISPYGAQGPTPTYSNPMQGVSGFEVPPPPLADPAQMGIGPRAISGIGNIGGGVVSGAAMVGSMALPGAAGRAMGMMDPYTAGLSGFARGAGLRAGGQGIMANMARIGRLGAGGIARAGVGGMMGAAAYAAPVAAIYAAGKYAVGQMTQGAQFHGQIHAGLAGMRHLNPMAQQGFGFSRAETGDITSMIRTMGHRDMQTGPQELARIMRTGVQSGLFRSVQDVKEFKNKFKETVDALKNIAETVNTTLEGAMPFFQAARRQGFWTPRDILQNAQQTRMTAQATGMSVAAVQQMAAQGTQMARRVGALGRTGAEGMMQTMQLVGGGLRSGAISEEQLQEVTGMRGPAGIRAMAGGLQASATRFASSRQARWLLAAMGNRGFQSLDPGAMGMLSSGMMGIGDISRMARRNIGQQGAHNFVLNERNLRGEMLRQGPQAQLGFVRSLVGGHLYGESGRSRLITRRLMQRYFGVGGRQADMISRLAREAPRIMEENQARTAAVMDQESRNREQMLERSFEGIKRKASQWWDKNVKDPLQQAGQQMSIQIGDFYERMGDKFWGRASRRWRFRGMESGAIQALQRANMGDTGAMARMFGTSQETAQLTGGLGLRGMQANLGTTGLEQVGGFARPYTQAVETGVSAMFTGGRADPLGWMRRQLTGDRDTNARIEAFRRLGVQEQGMGDAEARAALAEGRVVRGATQGGRQMYMRVEDLRRSQIALRAAQKGTITGDTAGALGFIGPQEMREKMEGARSIMETTDFMSAATGMANRGKRGMDLARALVGRIRSGEIGRGTALEDLVKGVDDNTAAMRLAAAQSKSTRSRVGGIDLSDEARQVSLGLMSPEAAEKEISDKLNAGMEGIANSMRFTMADTQKALNMIGLGTAKGRAIWGAVAPPGLGEGVRKLALAGAGGRMPGIDGASVGRMFDKGGEEMKQALSMWGAGDDKESRAENTEKAKQMLVKMAGDKKFSRSEREILIAMTDDKHPSHKALGKTLTTMGQYMRLRNRFSAAEVVTRRMARFQSSMGEQQEKIIAGLDAASDQESGNKMGQIVRELVGETEIEGYEQKLNELTQAAADSSPKQAARAAELIRGLSGGEQIFTAIMGGARVKMAAKALTRRTGLKQETMAANMLIAGYGGTITKEEMQRIRRRGEVDEKTREQILGRIQDPQAKAKADQLIRAIDEGDKQKIRELGIEGVRNRVIAQYGPPGKDLISRTLRARAGEIVGKKGSPEGIHTELSRQTAVLEAINKAVGGKPTTGNPKDGGDESGFSFAGLFGGKKED